MCLSNFYIKNHRPNYICPLLQITSLGQVWNLKGYHLDDLYIGHHDINKTGYIAINVPRLLQMSPVTANTTFCANYPP